MQPTCSTCTCTWLYTCIVHVYVQDWYSCTRTSVILRGASVLCRWSIAVSSWEFIVVVAIPAACTTLTRCCVARTIVCYWGNNRHVVFCEGCIPHRCCIKYKEVSVIAVLNCNIYFHDWKALPVISEIVLAIENHISYDKKKQTKHLYIYMYDICSFGSRYVCVLEPAVI